MTPPVSVLYGGAHLFKAETPKKLGALALKVLDTHAVDLRSFAELTALDAMEPGLCEQVYRRVRKKLEHDPVEDFRIDFEDGYGIRSAAETEEHARAVAVALAGAEVPRIGVRVRSLQAMGTLETILQQAKPRDLAITLPKVMSVDEVKRFADRIDELASKYGFGLRTELMIESKEALRQIAAICAAAGPRLESLHFGAYDFLSAFGVPADAQSLQHTFCDSARFEMLLHSTVRISDGATSQLPIGEGHVVPNMRLHAANVQRALDQGIAQGWDLHPAQLVARYSQVYAYYLISRDASAARLQKFVRTAAKARVDGGVFDDAATALGLINFFLSGYEAGALDDRDLEAAGVSAELLRKRSFEALLEHPR